MAVTTTAAAVDARGLRNGANPMAVTTTAAAVDARGLRNGANPMAVTTAGAVDARGLRNGANPMAVSDASLVERHIARFATDQSPDPLLLFTSVGFLPRRRRCPRP